MCVNVVSSKELLLKIILMSFTNILFLSFSRVRNAECSGFKCTMGCMIELNCW